MLARPHPTGCGVRRRRPELEVATIFREHGQAYRRTHALSVEQLRVMGAIARCRTAALGGHIDVCTSCGSARPSYNSCRNRHCPKCQGLAQAKWLEGRKQRLLPTHYFHVVFTLPSELRPLARLNPRLVYGLLFEASSQTLLELGRDPKRLGALLGVTCVLHTWSRTLALHPHIHCIVTGGGLAADGERWVASSSKFLFPLQVMARLFRGKVLCGLRRAHRRGELRLPDDLVESSGFDALLETLFDIDWVVYSKRPFGGPDNVYAYLGRYTHRVGLSNHRLRDIDDDHVTFVGRHDKRVTLTHHEFIRRFLVHVLPPGFVRLRHYGLLAPCNATTVLERTRELLGQPPPEPVDDITWRERFFQLTGVDLRKCTHCRHRTVERVAHFVAAPQTTATDFLDSS